MKEPIRSNIDLEAGVKPLVAALKVPKLADACKILFVNGDTLSLSVPLGQIGIITLQGSKTPNTEGADLLISETQMQLFDIGKHILPQLIHTFGDSIVSASVEVASLQSEKERQSIITAKVVEKVNSNSAKEFYKQITPYIGDAIKPVSELLVGVFYKFFYEKHAGQHQAIYGFEDVWVAMKRLGLLSPYLSLALCPSCNNYELVFSRSARFTPACTECGTIWPVLTINELTPEFATLKMKNCDLPVFISAYLRSKSPFDVNVFPNAEFNLDIGNIEIDVFIPDTLTGIECKCYTNNIAVTDLTISSKAGEIKQQIQNYLSLGLKRIILVTNYNEADTNKLRISLKERLEGMPGLKEWKVLGNDLYAFTKFLDEESDRLSQVMGKSIRQEFDHRITKQLAQKNVKRNRKTSKPDSEAK